jgi:hypothetical protein
MRGPEGRRPKVSPARKGWEIDPEDDPSAVGASLNRSVPLPFVIPSASEGSAVLRTISWECFLTERSVVELRLMRLVRVSQEFNPFHGQGCE